MPRFSIVIPSYNNAEFLPGCLDSLKAQSFSDWNAIVVVDASPDESADIVRSYAAEDSRFVLLNKDVNGGAHLARRDGVLAADGDYITFLDADDELACDALEKLSSILPDDEDRILHFGLTCEGEGVDSARAASFEGWANSSNGQLDRAGLLEAIFSTQSEYGKDWNVDHRVFSAKLAKRAFSQMTDERLARAEDGYEAFALACLSSGEVTADEIKGYRYFIGRGVTADSALTAERYATETKQLIECADAAMAFALSLNDKACEAAATAFRKRLVFSAANEWFDRVGDKDKDAALDSFVEIAGDAYAAPQLMRFARDEAFKALMAKAPYEENATYVAWYRRALDLAKRVGITHEESWKSIANPAKSHIDDVKHADTIRRYNASDIRIFVSTHKDVETFRSDILQPVQVGCANAGHRFPWALHDDEGDNISSQNPMYCELTTQYWAWKNVDAEYYGFCHYRRYFDFSEEKHEESPWGMVVDDYINVKTQKKYALDDASIRKAIEGYDVLTTECQDIREFPGPDETPLDQYKMAPLLHVEDLYKVIAILEDMHPDYAQDAETFLTGNTSRFCNMFIMKKSIFREYCSWLFPILDRFVAETDFSLYSVEAIRTPGHLAERLLNIYLIHQQRVGAGLKMKELQCVHFERPDRLHLKLDVPYEAAAGRPIVPVVFAADDGYVPMVTTTIRSMLDNASKDRFYDIVVLTSNISGEHQGLMRECLVGNANNASLRFHDVSPIASDFELATNNAHIGIETYYRFIIQAVMPEYDKVLYLDSDLVIEGDVAELYDTELGNNLLAATRDVDYLGNLNMNDGWRLNYTKTKLKMSDPYGYFQAGVLLLNIKAMREAYTTREWLEFASVRDYIVDDQDVLTTHCQGRVVYLDQAWNVMHDCGHRVANVFNFAPAYAYKAYMEARQRPLVRHYAGCDKPWNFIGCDWAEHYWRYARETPFYETLVAYLCTTEPKRNEDNRPAPVMGEHNPIRKIVDPLMPLGSRRREVAKKVGRKLRGRE